MSIQVNEIETGIVLTNSMSRLFIKANRLLRLSSGSSTKVHQIEILNGKRFQLIATVVRLIPDSIAEVTVAHLIPFIVEIPLVSGSFFLNGMLRPRG